jgi:hypothetical protein
MKHKLLRLAAFAVLVAGGAATANAVAGSGPLSLQQTESSSTSVSSSSSSTTTTTTTTTTTPRKIRICHHAGFKAGKMKHVTITINRSAWSAHQRHGDSMGACTTASAKKFHSRPAHIKRFHRKHR